MTTSQGVLVVGGISLVLASISTITALIPENKKEGCIKKIALITIMIIVISAIAITAFVNEFVSPDGEIKRSQKEILAKAKEWFCMDEYLLSIEEYEDDELDTNPIALNNQAYMYERGLGVSKDLEKAGVLYEKAKNRHNRTAERNWIVFSLQHPQSYSQIIDALRFGVEIEDPDVSKWIFWLIGLSEKNAEMTADEAFTVFENLGGVEQEKAIDRFIYEIDVPFEYYNGLTKGQFVSIKQKDDSRTVFTGSFEIREKDEITEITPIMSRIGGNYVVEKKISFAENLETTFIYDE